LARELKSFLEGIVNLFVERKFIAKLEEEKICRVTKGLKCSAMSQILLLRLAHSRSGIGSVKWHGIPQHTDGVFVVENAPRSGAISRKKALCMLC
jgi:hypothetical protein